MTSTAPISAAVTASELPSRAAVASGLRLRWIRDLEPVRADWQRLACASGNVFFSWEWASTWYEHLGPGRAPLIAAASIDGAAPAVLVPLYPGRHRGIPCLRLIGDRMGAAAGPVCAPADRALGRAALAEAIATAPGRHAIFVGEALAGDEGWERTLPGSHRRERAPVLRIGDRDWDGYLAALSRNTRQEIRRRPRRLQERHDVRLRLADPGSLSADLEALFALHAARWRSGESHAFTTARRAFHRRFAPLALERGWLRLWTLELDGRPAAAWYGLRSGTTEWYYQSGRDPAFDPEGVGIVLLAHTIRAAIEDGMREYRFLVGDEPYKQRYANDDPGDLTVVAPTRGAGRAILAAAAARRAVRAGLRALPNGSPRSRSRAAN